MYDDTNHSQDDKVVAWLAQCFNDVLWIELVGTNESVVFCTLIDNVLLFRRES